jgi:hypothetical protein
MHRCGARRCRPNHRSRTRFASSLMFARTQSPFYRVVKHKQRRSARPHCRSLSYRLPSCVVPCLTFFTNCTIRVLFAQSTARRPHLRCERPDGRVLVLRCGCCFVASLRLSVFAAWPERARGGAVRPTPCGFAGWPNTPPSRLPSRMALIGPRGVDG